MGGQLAGCATEGCMPCGRGDERAGAGPVAASAALRPSTHCWPSLLGSPITPVATSLASQSARTSSSTDLRAAGERAGQRGHHRCWPAPHGPLAIDRKRHGGRRDVGEPFRRGSRPKPLPTGAFLAPASLPWDRHPLHSLIDALLVELAPHAPHHAVNNFLVALHAQGGEVVVAHHFGVSTTAGEAWQGRLRACAAAPTRAAAGGFPPPPPSRLCAALSPPGSGTTTCFTLSVSPWKACTLVPIYSATHLVRAVRASRYTCRGTHAERKNQIVAGARGTANKSGGDVQARESAGGVLLVCCCCCGCVGQPLTKTDGKLFTPR